MSGRGAVRLLGVLSLLMTSLVWITPTPVSAQDPAEVSISDVSVTEINGVPPTAYKNVLVTFSVTGVRNGPLFIDYVTVDTGSATSDVDYRNFTQTVQINAGQSSVTRAIRVYGDTIPEPTETFEVHLTNPVNAQIGNGIATVTIIDNDGYVPPAGPTLSVADLTVTEGDAGTTTANVTVTMSETDTSPVTVDLSAAPGTALAGSDYIDPGTATLTIPAGQTSVTQPIDIVGDTVFESTETFAVNLSNPTVATIADGNGLITILDNDPEPPGMPDLSVSDETVDEDAGTVTVTISADETSTNPVTFDLATADDTATAGSDYTAVGPTQVTLPANTLSVTQAIPILDDQVGESPETFRVQISNVSANGAIADGEGIVTIDDDDAPPCTAGPYVTVGDLTVTETEFEINAIVTFTASYPNPTASTRVRATTIDGTAVAPGDYTAKTNQLIVIPRNQTTKTLAFKIQGDTVAEATETFDIQITEDLRACVDPNNDTGTVTILDNDGPPPPPTPDVSVSDASTTETDGASSVNVVVSLDQTTTNEVTVLLSTADGTAIDGSDYTGQTATTVTIPAGQLTATVPIDIIGDTLFEPTETFAVNLSSPTNANIGDGSATVTILDNDPAPPAVSVADASTNETDGPSTVDVTLNLDQVSGTDVTVLLSTADGTATAGADYTAVNQALVTILAGQTSATFTLDIIGDDVYEGDENFFVNLTSPTNAILGDAQGEITIIEDEPIPPVVPDISVSDATTTETDGASTVDVTVTLDQPTSNTVTVDLSTADNTATAGSDYNAVTNTPVTFNPGSTSQTVSLGIIGDDVAESTEDFTVNLTNPVNGTIVDGQGVVTIDDDDAPVCTTDPQVTVGDITVTETEFEINAIVTFTRSYSTNLSSRVIANTIDGTAVAPGDYTARTNQLVVIQGGQTTKTLAFKVQGDSIAELTETFDVQITADLRACVDPNDDTGTVTIIDNDGPPAPSVSVADATTTEGDVNTTVDVTVSLDSTSLNPVTVDIATADGTAIDGSDYTALSPTTLTIPAGQTSVTQTIDIIGDTIFEPTEEFTVNLSNPTNANLGDGTATITIDDNDPAPPALSVADVSTNETDGPSTVDVTVNLDQAAAGTVTVDLSTADGTATAGADYTAVSQQQVSIPAGQTSATVTLDIIGDDDFEGDENFFVNLTNPSGAIIGDGQGEVTIVDDEPPPPVTPNISVGDVSTTETDVNTTVDVTVSLSEPTSNTVTVDLSTADNTATSGTDYVAVTNTPVTFNPGSTSETVTLTIVGDDVTESNESFFVNLTNPANGVIVDGQGEVTIIDDDAPACTDGPYVTVDDLSITEGDAFTKNAQVTFRIPTPQALSTRVRVNTVDDTATAPSDYEARVNQLVVIAAGELTKTLVIKINGDTVDEGDEDLLVQITPDLRACVDPNDDHGVLTILNDDGPPVPRISVGDAATTEGDVNTTVDVTVSMDITSASPVTVDLSTVDGSAIAGSDYTALAPTTVTIPAGQTSVTQTIDIVGDTVFEPTETFDVVASNPSGATILDGTGTVTITDNDPDPGGTADISVQDLTITEDDVDITAQVTVEIDETSASDVDVQFTTSDGSAVAPGDYTAVDTLVTIPAGQLSVTQDITIIGDDDEESSETINVTLTNPVNGTILDGTAVVTIDDDDTTAPILPSLRVLDATVVEGDGTPGVATKNFQVTFELSPGNFIPSGQANFMWQTVDTGSATDGLDYPFQRSEDPQTQADLPVVIPIPAPGAQPNTVVRTLKIYGDTEDEIDETFEVHLFNATSNMTVADGIATVTIVDNDGPPDLTITDVSADEGTSATLSLDLSYGVGQQVDVQVDTTDGSAVAPGDYTAVTSQIVSFPANTTTATIDIPIANDGLAEGAEDFTVNLSNAVNAVIADNQATVTINDVQTTPELSIADVSTTEGDDTFKSVLLNITLSPASSQQVDVTFATANDTAIGGTESPADFQRVNGAPVSFAPGETTKTVSVKIFGDTEDENDETFFVNLTNPVNATLLDGQAVVTIIDNDTTPAITIDDLTVLEGDGSGPTFFVTADATLTLDTPSTTQVDVQVDTADGTATAGSDYEAIVAQTVSFAPNTTTATVTVKVFSNDLEDGNRDFVLNLTNPVGATIADNQATVTIDDNDDPAKVLVSDLSVTEGDGAAPNDFVNADVVVSVDTPVTGPVTVDLTTADGTATAGTDYEAATALAVTVPDGQSSVIVPIKVFGDFADEGDEDFTVTIANPSANVTLGNATATVTIVDNDVTPDVSIAGVTVTEGDTSFQFAQLTLTLSEASNQQVDVELDSTDGTATEPDDYESVDGTIVSFPAGQTTATTFVKVFGDFDVEPTEEFTVGLINPVNANVVGTPATVTIIDQDTAPQISIADATVTEGDGSAPNDFVTVDLTLTTDITPGQNVSVDLTTADGSATGGVDYEALSGTTASFTAGSSTTTVALKVFGDTDFEGTEDLTVTLSNPVGGVIDDGTATVTILDNDVDPSLPNLRVEDIFVTEGDANQGNVELIVILEQASDTTIRATLTMEDITATSGTGPGDGDYVPVIDLPLVFSPGDRILKRVIKINGDTDYEGNETARILLTPNTTPTTSDDANIVDGEGILTILDSEVGPGDGPAIYIADVTQQEGGNVGFNNVEVTFILDEPSGAQVLFDVAAADGTGPNAATLAGGDYQDPTTHLVMPIVFAPGNQIVKRNFRVNGDTELEGNEEFRLLVQNVVGGTIGDGEGIVTILDTDLPDGNPTVNVFDIIDGENGDVGTENATIKFFLDQPSANTVTVQYQPIDGTLTAANGDYDPNVASPTVSFLPGEQIAEKPVIINRDNDYTGVQYLDVQISNPTGGATIGDGVGRVTIYDDEQQANLPGIFMTTTDIVELNAGASIANLKGYIDRPFNGSVTADFILVDGSARQGIDYTNASGAGGTITSITWSGGEQVSETKANVIGDNYFEPNEQFELHLISVTGDAQIIDGTGTINILDNDDENDPPEPSFDDADIAVSVTPDVTAANGGDTVTYTIDVTNNGPDDGKNVEATLTLPTGLTLATVGGCANATGTTCSFGTVANGVTVSYTVSATVDLITSGVVTATATASTSDIDSPQTNNTDTADVTATSPYDNDVVYVSSTSNGNVGGVAFNDEDILAFDRSTGQWSMFFDGSDEGLVTLDGFNIVDFTPGATVIDITMTSPRSIGGLGTVDDADVIRFTGTTGTNTSSTSWEWVIDGSDIGLTTSAENIDAVAGVGVDDFALSIIANGNASGLTIKEQDVLLFDPTSTGQTTTGTLSLLSDGSTIDMASSAEDVNGAWVDSNGDIYLTTIGNLNANGFTADFDDIVILTDTVAGTFQPYFDGDLVGFGVENIDGLHIQRGP